MEFRISDTFTDSLTKLTNDEQKLVKTKVFDLQVNPDSTGLQFHKIDKSKDKNFWSVYVNMDIRLIVHKTQESILICFVAHHDKAYTWAERRKLEIHPTTGAAQLVEVREMVKEIIVPKYIEEEIEKEKEVKLIFSDYSTEELLEYGVPNEWINDVKQATELTLLALIDHLPSEAAESLLEIATGGTPKKPQSVDVTENPFDHPDALRRFRVMSNVDELSRALEYPWEKWTIFLHPEQRQVVSKTFSGPARVSGSAGTGKSIVAIHRAVHLAKTNPDSRVLLTTYSDSLANSLKIKLNRLISNEPKLAERIDVYSINSIGIRLYKKLVGNASIATQEEITEIIKNATAEVPNPKFSLHFLIKEWQEVIDEWQLKKWDDYKNFVRLGRKTRLIEEQRKTIWSIFEIVQNKLAERKLITYAGLFTELEKVVKNTNHPIFDYAVVDESQDISVCHIRFFAALGKSRTDSLFFAGDLGQRIFQQPFSWLSLGVDIRGRSKTLKVNYRTSHQIRSKADLLLNPEIIDFDGNVEDRSNTVSIFNGPSPQIHTFRLESEESFKVRDWINELRKGGVLPNEIGVFVRSEEQLKRAKKAVEAAGLSYKILDENVETTSGYVSICTMHLAKGLEFRAVVVMACDDEVIPLQSRIESVGDDADLKEVYDTERQLLYVACTRARDYLLITGVEPTSEFLDDMML